MPIGNVYVDGLNVGDVGEESLRSGGSSARRLHGRHRGRVERSTGRSSPGAPVTKGFSDDPAAFDAALPLVEEDLNARLQDDDVDPHRLSQVIRRTVGQVGKPSDTQMIIPTVLEV